VWITLVIFAQKMANLPEGFFIGVAPLVLGSLIEGGAHAGIFILLFSFFLFSFCFFLPSFLLIQFFILSFRFCIDEVAPIYTAYLRKLTKYLVDNLPAEGKLLSRYFPSKNR